MLGKDSNPMDVENPQEFEDEFEREIRETLLLEQLVAENAEPLAHVPEEDVRMFEDSDAPAEPDEQAAVPQEVKPLTTEERKAIRSERSSKNKELKKIASQKSQLERGLEKSKIKLQDYKNKRVMHEMQQTEQENIEEMEREITLLKHSEILLKARIEDIDKQLAEDKALRERLQQAHRKGGARRARKAKPTTRPANYNFDSGDDSATDDPDDDEAKNRRRRERRISNFPDGLSKKDQNRYRPPACRWCQKAKRSCDQRVPRCTECVTHQKRCRYNDPWTGKQIPAMYTVTLEMDLNAKKEEISRLKEKISKLESQQGGGPLDFTSKNPFSGITGYGPRPMRHALESLKRAIVGLPMLPDHSETVSSENDGPGSANDSDASRKRKATSVSDGDNSVATKRVRLTCPPRMTTRRKGPRTRQRARKEEASGTGEASRTAQQTISAVNEGPVVLNDSNDQWTNGQQINAEEMIDDQTMQNAPSNVRADEAQGGSGDVQFVGEARSTKVDNSQLPPGVPYASHFEGLNKKQLMYLRSLAKRNRSLPLRSDHTPIWPEWSYKDEPLTDDELACLKTMLDEGDHIDGKDGKVNWKGNNQPGKK